MKNYKVNLVLVLSICVTALILGIGGWMAWDEAFSKFGFPVIGNPVVDEIIVQLPDIEVDVPVATIEEKAILPFTVNAKRTLSFFDRSLSDDQLKNAVVEYNGVYRPNLGTLYRFDGKAFEAIAILSGTVEQVYLDPLMGNTVVLKHKDAYITYQGLSSVTVKKGMAITQGAVVGVAGESVYHKNQGIHLFVSAKINNQYVNVEKIMDKAISEWN
ncbi:MAG: M23 family metallopeptidase [Erysipelotrichaceae bacterium]|nr:M23 family metallopeptidase [Erysipelotrichaceae bacterium]